MAYNLRFYGIYVGFYNGVQYEIEINERDYSGGWEYIEWGGYPDPVEDRIRGDRENSGQVIIGRQLEIIIHPTLDNLEKYDDLFYSQYKDYEIIHKRNGQPIFRGWLQPENIEQDFVNTPYAITLSATDGLSELKNEPFVDSDDSLYLDDYMPVIEIISKCIQKIGLPQDLDFEVMINTYETDQMDYDSTSQHPNECSLAVVNVNPHRFIKEGVGREGAITYKKNIVGIIGRKTDSGGGNSWPAVDPLGNRDPSERRRHPGTEEGTTNRPGGASKADLKSVDNCYTVIEKVLQPFNATLRQINGEWVIENQNELDSQVFRFNGTPQSDGSLTEKTTSPVSIDRKLIINDSDNEPFGNLSRIAPRKKFYTEFMSYRISQREENLNSWDQNESDPDWLIDSGHPYNEYATVNSSSQYNLSISTSITGKATPRCAIESRWFYIDVPDDYDPSVDKKYIRLRLQMKLDGNMTKDFYPAFRIAILRPPLEETMKYVTLPKELTPTFKIRKNYKERSGITDYNYFFWDEYSYWISPMDDNFLVDRKGYYKIAIFIFPNEYSSLTVKFQGRPDVRIENTNTDESPRDKRQYQENPNVPGLDGGSLSLAFGDGVYNDEIGVFTIYDIDTNKYIKTSSWNRWERDDNIPIIWTYLQQQLNNGRDYVKVATIGRYDKADEISPNNILVLPTGDSDSPGIEEYYKIIGWRRKYRTGYVKLQLIQLFTSYTHGDVGNPITEYTLDTLDGVNQDISFPKLRAIDETEKYTSNPNVIFNGHNEQIGDGSSYTFFSQLVYDSENDYGIEPGDTLTFSAEIKVDSNAASAGVSCRLVIYTKKDGEIYRSVNVETSNTTYERYGITMITEGGEEEMYLTYNGDLLTYNGQPLVTSGEGIDEIWAVIYHYPSGISTGNTYARKIQVEKGYKSSVYMRPQVAVFGADETQTIINGGLITTGGLIVKNSAGNERAGIVGYDYKSDDTLLWVGDTSDNKNSAPFRVDENGNVVMTKAKIQTSESGKRTVIDSSDNSMKFYDTNGNLRLIVNENIYSAFPGVKVQNASGDIIARYMDQQARFTDDSESNQKRTLIDSNDIVITDDDLNYTFQVSGDSVNSKLLMKFDGLPIYANANSGEVCMYNDGSKVYVCIK